MACPASVQLERSLGNALLHISAAPIAECTCIFGLHQLCMHACRYTCAHCADSTGYMYWCLQQVIRSTMVYKMVVVMLIVQLIMMAVLSQYDLQLICAIWNHCNTWDGRNEELEPCRTTSPCCIDRYARCVHARGSPASFSWPAATRLVWKASPKA